MNKWVFVLICSLPSPSTHCYLDFTNRAPKNNFFVVTRRSFFSRIHWTFSRCLFYLTALWHFTHLTNFFFRLAPSLGFGDRGSCWFSQDNTDRSFLGSSLWLLSLCSLLTLGIYQGLTLGSFLLTPSFPFGQLVHNQGFNSHPGTDGLKGKPMSQTSLWNSSLVMPAAYLTFLTLLPSYLIDHTTVNKDITQFIISPTRLVPPPVFPTQDALFTLILSLET